MSVLDVVAGDAVAAYSGAPSWVIPPADGSINTQAFVELTNPATGETWMAPSGGYTVNPDVTTQIPQQVTIPAMQGVQTQPVDRPVADVVEGNRFQMQYPEDGLLTDPTIFAAIDILNRAPAVGPTAAAAAADQSTLLGSGLYEVLPDTDPAIESDVTPLYGVDWRDRIKGTEEQPEGITTTITTDDSSYDDSWDGITYEDFLSDLSETYTGSLTGVTETLGGIATDLGEGFVQIGDSIVDTATGIVTDLTGEITNVVGAIGESITGTLDDFGLGGISDALSDIGVSIDEVATDLGEGFVQIGDAIVDTATGIVTDIGGDLLGVVEDIGENITSTLDDFGLGSVADSLSDLGVSIGEVATDLGSGFVQIGDAIVDSATGVVTDLSGELMGVVEDIGENITSTLDDFGLGSVSDSLSDLGVSIGEVATDLGSGFVQIGDAIVDSATGVVTDLSGELMGVVEDIGENITSTLDDFGLGSVSDSLSDLGVSIGEVATDLGSGFVQIGDAIVDSATGVVTDLSGELMGVVEDIGENITSTLDDFGLGSVSDSLSDLGVSIGEVATDLGSGFVQIGDAIVDSATGVVTDLSGELMGVVEDIGENITSTLDDFGLGSVSDALSDIGVSIDEVATDLGSGFVQIGDAIVDSATGVVTDLSGDLMGVVEDIGETITSTLDDFGLGSVADSLSDIGVSIDEVATDLGSGFVQIGDAIVDSATGVVTDLSGDLLGVVEDIGEDIGGAVTDITTGLGSAVETIGEGIEGVTADIGTAVETIGTGIEEAVSPVTEALSPITDTLGEVKENVSGFVGDIESVVGDAITSALPDQPDDPEGVGAQYQGEFGAVLSVINNMAEGMTVEEALDALYSDPETGLAPGEVGSPYGWDWGSILDPAYGSLSFTTPYDVVDAQGDPATTDPGGIVTDSEGNPVAVESGGVLGYGDLDTAADVYGTEPGSEQTGMLTEQDAGLTDYSDQNLGTAAEYGTDPGSEQTEMLAEQDLGPDPEPVTPSLADSQNALKAGDVSLGLTLLKAYLGKADPIEGITNDDGSITWNTPTGPATTYPAAPEEEITYTDVMADPEMIETEISYADTSGTGGITVDTPTGPVTSYPAVPDDLVDIEIEDVLATDPTDPDDFDASDAWSGTGYDDFGGWADDFSDYSDDFSDSLGDDSGFGDDGIGSSSSDDGWGGGDVAGGDTGAGDTADGGGGDGGGDCFIASTLVDMADGSKKRIDDVVIGDKVLSADGARTNMVKYIEKIDWKDDYILYSPDEENEPFITQNHPVMVDGEWVSSDIEYTRENHPWIEAKPLDGGRRSSGNKVVVYNLWVDGDHTFKVNGYGTSSLIGDGGVVRHGLEQGIIDWDDFVSIVSGAKDAGHLINYGMHLGNRIMAKFSKNKRYTKWILDSVMGKRKGYTIKTLIYLFGAAGILSKPRLWFGERGSFDALETADQGVKT